MKVVGSHGWVYLHHDDVIDILGYSCIHSLKMLLVYVHMFSQYDMKAQDDFGMWYLTWPMVNLRRFYKQILTTWCFYVCYLTPILTEDISNLTSISFEMGKLNHQVDNAVFFDNQLRYMKSRLQTCPRFSISIDPTIPWNISSIPVVKSQLLGTWLWSPQLSLLSWNPGLDAIKTIRGTVDFIGPTCLIRMLHRLQSLKEDFQFKYI